MLTYVGVVAMMIAGLAGPASARYISTGGSNGHGYEDVWYSCAGSACVKWTGVYGHAHAIQTNKQVRVYGDRWGTDPKTQWFTTLDRNYYASRGYLTGNTPKMGQR